MVDCTEVHRETEVFDDDSKLREKHINVCRVQLLKVSSAALSESTPKYVEYFGKKVLSQENISQVIVLAIVGLLYSI